jgi:arylsulfatase
VTYHPIQADEPGLDAAAWELYDLRADPSECHDLAAAEPERLQDLIDRWWAEAERYQVLPLDNRPFSDLVLERPPAVPPRSRYAYRPHRAPVPESVAANVKNRAHTITAHVELAEAPAEGVLAVQGSVLGGWSFHLLGDGRLCYVHNLAGWRTYRVEAPVADRLTPGPHTLAFRFTPGPGGTRHRGTLLVDGHEVGAGDIARVAWSRFSITGAGLTVGWSPDLSPADRDYRGPFRFTAHLDRVEIDVDGPESLDVLDAAAEADAILRSQ